MNWSISHNIIANTNSAGINPQQAAPNTSVNISHNFLGLCYAAAIQGNGGACVIQSNAISFGLGQKVGTGIIGWVNMSRATITDNVIFDSDLSSTSNSAINVGGYTSTTGDILIANNVVTGLKVDWTDVIGAAITVDTSTVDGGGPAVAGTVIVANNLIDNCGANDPMNHTQARAIVVSGPYTATVKVYGNTIRNRLPNNIRIGIRVVNSTLTGTVPAGAVTIGRNYFDFDPMDTVQVQPYVVDSPAKLDGRISESKRTVSTSTTLLMSDEDVLITGNNVGLTLPDATLSYLGGKRIMIKNAPGQTGNTTVTPGSGQKIDGLSTALTMGTGASYTLQSDGSNWLIVAKV